VSVGLCELSFLLLEHSVEYLIEYLSTRHMPEVAINYRVGQQQTDTRVLPSMHVMLYTTV